MYDLGAANINGSVNFYELWAANVNQSANFYNLWPKILMDLQTFINYGLQILMDLHFDELLMGPQTIVIYGCKYKWVHRLL